MLSFNRGPGALRDALVDRETLETSAFPLTGAVRAKLRELKAATPESRIFFVACKDSIILPILQDRALAALVVTEGDFRQLLAAGHVRAGDLVVEDCPSGSDRLVKIVDVDAPDIYAGYGERRRGIYRFGGRL
jgi:hypothetical protein